MTRRRRDGKQMASFRTEATGWLAFFLFVAGMYRLRQVLNRGGDER